MLDDEEVTGSRPTLPNSRRWMTLALGLVVTVSCFLVKQPSIPAR